MSSSPQEKDKLRKRLQKLFEKQETLKKPATGKIDTSSLQDKKGKMNTVKETKTFKQLKLKETNIQSNKSNSKNIKKPEKIVKNTVQILKDAQEKVKETSSSFNKINTKNIKKQQYVKNSDKILKNPQERVEETISPSNKMNSKNIKNQQSVKNSKEILNDASKQNGHVKAPKKLKNLSKSEGSALKKGKQKEYISEQKQDQKMCTKQESKFNNTSPSKHKKMQKPIKDNSKPKKSLNKNHGGKAKILENTSIESHEDQNVTKSHKLSTSKQSNSISKINQIQKEKCRKRVSADKVNVSSKKQKLVKKADKKNKKLMKCNQIQKFITDEPEYDVKVMAGYVRGGDFDSRYDDDELEHNYWMQYAKCSDNEYSSDDNMCQGNNVVDVFMKNSQADLGESYQNESSDSDMDYFDSGDDNEFDDYYGDSYEEENYSDFDEIDYEEDEDSYDYSMDNDDYFSSNSYDYDKMYDSNNSDDDYELPRHVPEDLIIPKGTANKRNLKSEDKVSFNSDNEEFQIVELENQHTVKVIHQPKAYEKEELLKLHYEEKSSSAITFHRKETTSSDSEDCPKLVPILDEDGFQLFNPNEDEVDEFEGQSLEDYESDSKGDNSLGSEYVEINSDDADSLLSEDINDKYLSIGYEDSDSSIDENMWGKKHNVDIIDATCYEYEKKAFDSTDVSECSLNDNIKQLPSMKLFENVDLNTESNIFCARIVDHKMSDPNFDETNEKQNVSSGLSDPTPTENASTEKLQMEKECRSDQASKVSKSIGDYNTKFFNALDSNLVMVLLKDPFYIYGTVRLILLAGRVEVYGHSLILNEEVEMFSPRGCSVIEISSSNENCNISQENLKQLLTTYEKHFALADLKSIVNLYNAEKDAVLLLKRNESRKKVVQQFKKFMNENVFPNISNINVDRPLYNSEYLLRCMINTSTQEQKCLRLPQQWQELSITSKSRVMLAGGKGVGKSTLLRYLINRHLPQKVLLIDLDIGQPEVFIPQTISCTIVKQPLLGPGFLLNLQPDLSYAIGHTNIALCAHRYVDAVRWLIAHCKAQEEYREIPWLVNTMGYNKGFGLELISVIAQELPLTDVIQLQSTKEICNFDTILHAHVLNDVPHVLFWEEHENKDENIKEKLNYNLHVWQSAVQQESRYQKEWEMSAKDLRFAMLLARLSDGLHGHAEWLTDTTPLSASLDEVKIINLMDSCPSASREELEKSIEANLVYLCQYEEDVNALKCLGIGVVRAIDFYVRQLYLVPALPHTKLKNVNCLAVGEMPLPTSLFTNQGPRIKNIVPFVYNTISANASKAIKQIYHRPSKFLTGKHKSLD